MVPRLFGAEHLLGKTQALGVDLIRVLLGAGFGFRFGVRFGLGFCFGVGFGLGFFALGLGFDLDLDLGSFTFERFRLAFRLFAFGFGPLALVALFSLVLLILVYIFVDAVLGLEALEAERQPATLGVDLDDLDVDLLTGLQDLGRLLYVVLSQLGDVDEAFDPFLDLDERAEAHQLGDLAMHDLVDLPVLEDLLPRVFLSLLESQADPLALAVDVEQRDVDLLADVEHLRGVIDMAPGELGDVDQAVDAVQVHEGAKVNDVGDRALHDVAHVHPVEDLLADPAALLLEHGAAAEHDIVAEAVEFDHPALERLTGELLEIVDPTDVHKRSRQEPAHAQVQDQTALNHLDDGALHGLAFLGGLFDPLPGTFETGTLLREDQTPIGVFLGHDQGVDHVAQIDLFAGVHRLTDRELVGRNHALALVADVDQHLVFVDADQSAGNDLTLFEGDHHGIVVGDHLPVDLDHEVLPV